MIKKPCLLGIFFTFATLFVVTSANAATWTTINGRVLSPDGSPLCAMVLANGQFGFTCDGTGSYAGNVPLDSSGLITLQVFASGFAPFRLSQTPSEAISNNTYMDRDTSGRAFTITHNVDSSSRTNWAVVSGAIHNNGTPLCAMILINGQNMFSCNGNLGQYSLEVPLDSSGNITLQAFVAGFQPYRETFSGQPEKPFNQVQTERLIGTWDFFYTILSLWEDVYTLVAPAIVNMPNPGEYQVFGTDTFGNPDVIAGYDPNSGTFALIDLGGVIDQFYSFNFTGPGTVTGCYYQIDNGIFSQCYPLDGFRIASAAVQAASVNNLDGGDGTLHGAFSQGEKEALQYQEAQNAAKSPPSAGTPQNGFDPVDLSNLYRKLKRLPRQ